MYIPKLYPVVILPCTPPLITFDQPAPKPLRERIYRSMAIPARARTPMPAASLEAAPVYLATAGPVVVAATGKPLEPATTAAGALLGAAQVVGTMVYVL